MMVVVVVGGARELGREGLGRGKDRQIDTHTERERACESEAKRRGAKRKNERAKGERGFFGCGP